MRSTPGGALAGAAAYFSVCWSFVPLGRAFAPATLAPRPRPRTSLSAASISSALLEPGITAIDSANVELEGHLRRLREKPYFRLYSVDILGSCEYMPQELFECYSESCEIYPVDDDEIPPSIRSVDFDEHDFELDGWARWDMPSEDYYDTSQFPEEYTGYDGSDVWRFIHSRIGFPDGESTVDTWKADFNKAVSGLHSMISCQVVLGIRDKVESGEGFDDDNKWTDPQIEFNRRIGLSGETPDAMENLYFGYMLLLSAVGKARDRLLTDCQSGKIGADDGAEDLQTILSSPLLDDPAIAVASQTLRDHALMDVNALWEARMRTRDLYRIMNCVQCNKCRLHGKISAMGLSTAFQILLGRTGEGGDAMRVHRVELATLMTALSKFSTAVNFCQQMRQ